MPLEVHSQFVGGYNKDPGAYSRMQTNAIFVSSLYTSHGIPVSTELSDGGLD